MRRGGAKFQKGGAPEPRRAQSRSFFLVSEIFDLFGDPIPENWGKRGRPQHIPTLKNRAKSADCWYSAGTTSALRRAPHNAALAGGHLFFRTALSRRGIASTGLPGDDPLAPGPRMRMVLDTREIRRRDDFSSLFGAAALAFACAASGASPFSCCASHRASRTVS